MYTRQLMEFIYFIHIAVEMKKQGIFIFIYTLCKEFPVVALDELPKRNIGTISVYQKPSSNCPLPNCQS